MLQLAETLKDLYHHGSPHGARRRASVHSSAVLKVTRMQQEKLKSSVMANGSDKVHTSEERSGQALEGGNKQH